jgi:hypothetical protein
VSLSKQKQVTSMPRKKKNPVPKSVQMSWDFGPDVPTHDFLEEGPLDDPWNLQQAVEDFVFWVKEDQFLTWEAVVCEEQGLPLTAAQQKALRRLLSFNDEEDDDEILYIDEIPRPSERWHVILNKIVPHLLTDEPLRTFDVQEEVFSDGWHRIVTALAKKGQNLLLPPDVASCLEVVPADLRHKLWLQYCFNDLAGLGQDEELTLEDPEQHYRVEEFIEHLRDCKESVAYFGLTLQSLLTRVILPDKDQPIFIKMMQEKLGLGSAQERIADRL